MAHTHPVVDSDSSFVINSTTREISTTSDKLELIQGDHQSERITFEIPKIVEGHDMSLSDRIEVHYINIDRKTNATSRDVYIIDDAAVDGDNLTFSWLISDNATKYYGRLNFIILFECLDPDGNYTYKWNTEICKLLTIGEGISNTSAVIEDHSDILEKFKKEILEEAGGVDPNDIAKAVVDYLAANPIEETDPTVPEWAKNKTKPAYSAAEVGAISQDNLQAATSEALAQAKASGEFDGANGKTAYQYAVDGGYTGTEAEFASKLAQEKFANPNALTFTGAATGSYDGSMAVSVEIPIAVTDDHINSLIDEKLGVIENGSY